MAEVANQVVGVSVLRQEQVNRCVRCGCVCGYHSQVWMCVWIPQSGVDVCVDTTVRCGCVCGGHAQECVYKQIYIHSFCQSIIDSYLLL